MQKHNKFQKLNAKGTFTLNFITFYTVVAVYLLNIFSLPEFITVKYIDSSICTALVPFPSFIFSASTPSNNNAQRLQIIQLELILIKYFLTNVRFYNLYGV